jgi:hypothetical protein
MSAVLARLGVLLAVLCLGLAPPLATVAQARTAPKAPTAHRSMPIPGPCAATYWSHAYDAPCAKYLADAMEGDRMSHNLRSCLVNVGITVPLVAVGGIIGGVAARGIAGALVTGGGLACIQAIRAG